MSQPRPRDAGILDRLGVRRHRNGVRFLGRFPGALPVGLLFDQAGVRNAMTLTAIDRLRHPIDRMPTQQLQDPYVFPIAPTIPMPGPKRVAQLPEGARQFPSAVNVRVVQRRRLASERRQEMQRNEDLFVTAIGTLMTSHHLAQMDHFDPLDVRLDRHGSERHFTRHAVPVRLVTDRLVLVDFAGP